MVVEPKNLSMPVVAVATRTRVSDRVSVRARRRIVALIVLLATLAAGAFAAPAIHAAPTTCDPLSALGGLGLQSDAGGVYQLVDLKTGEVMRTGKTDNLLRRCQQHGRHRFLRRYKFVPLYRTDDATTRAGLEEEVNSRTQSVLNRVRTGHTVEGRASAEAHLAQYEPNRARNHVGVEIARATQVRYVVYRKQDGDAEARKVALNLVYAEQRLQNAGRRGSKNASILKWDTGARVAVVLVAISGAEASGVDGVVAAVGKLAADGGAVAEIKGAVSAGQRANPHAEHTMVGVGLAAETAVQAAQAATAGPDSNSTPTPSNLFSNADAGQALTTGTTSDDDLGGVDFSTLELRYLADVGNDRTAGMAYAFKAPSANDGKRRGGGRRAARLASDAFFVWLALPTSAMWVNLNPSEPDRIIDPRFGRTSAGRVLLEADLRMKKTAARLTNPNTPLGARFWRELEAGSAGQQPCFTSRMWIVPGPATVRETADELYIIKAPLKIRTESDPLTQLASGCHGDARRGEALFRRLILPRVQRAVRQAPGFAALRSVYLSRVGAEWYRKREQRGGGAFADIIDSGDVSRWAPKRSWTPRQTFRRYVRSYKHGEYNVTRRTREGNFIITHTYVDGGVDFANVPRQRVSAEDLQALRPGLPGRLSRALSRPTPDPQLGSVWLAGASFDSAVAFGHPAVDGAAKAPGSSLLAIAIVLICGLLAGGWRVARAWRRARRPTSTG